jgi:hypothetical protein
VRGWGGLTLGEVTEEEKQRRAEAKRIDHKARLIKELVATEESYVKNLGVVVNVAPPPCAVFILQVFIPEVSTVTPYLIDRLFGGVEKIRAVNERLLADLSARLSAGMGDGDVKIGDIMQRAVGGGGGASDSKRLVI